MSKKYVYFVSYSHKGFDGNSGGFGCSELSSDCLVTSFADIQTLIASIEAGAREQGQTAALTGVVILNYQLLRTEDA